MSEPNLDSVPATPVAGHPPDLTEDAAEAAMTEAKQKAEDLIRDIANLLAQQEGLPEGAGP
jgi:hypothetical protein